MKSKTSTKHRRAINARPTAITHARKLYTPKGGRVYPCFWKPGLDVVFNNYVSYIYVSHIMYNCQYYLIIY